MWLRWKNMYFLLIRIGYRFFSFELCNHKIIEITKFWRKKLRKKIGLKFWLKIRIKIRNIKYEFLSKSS